MVLTIDNSRHSSRGARVPDTILGILHKRFVAFSQQLCEVAIIPDMKLGHREVACLLTWPRLAYWWHSWGLNQLHVLSRKFSLGFSAAPFSVSRCGLLRKNSAWTLSGSLTLEVNVSLARFSQDRSTPLSSPVTPIMCMLSLHTWPLGFLPSLFYLPLFSVSLCFAPDCFFGILLHFTDSFFSYLSIISSISIITYIYIFFSSTLSTWLFQICNIPF